MSRSLRTLTVCALYLTFSTGCGNTTGEGQDDKDASACATGDLCDEEMGSIVADMPRDLNVSDMSPRPVDMNSVDMPPNLVDMNDSVDMRPVDMGPVDMPTLEDMGGMDGGQDMATGMDMSQPDMGVMLRTLSDWRRCRSNTDCPVGLGACVKEASLNRPDGLGRMGVPMHEIFNELSPGEGVCTFVCTSDEKICEGLTLQGTTPDPVPHACQLVFTGESPYVEPAPAFPFDDQLDVTGMVVGRPFAALCLPPFGMDPSIEDSFCQSCMASSDCGGQALCWDAASNQEAVAGSSGVCLSGCVSDAECPMGNSCLPVGANSYCVPDSGVCGACRDRDGDGRGDGRCGSAEAPVTPFDCDDTDPGVYFDPIDPLHPFPTTCGEQDYNCNGISDAAEQVGTQRYATEHCEGCFEQCSGSVPNAVKTCVDRLDDTGTSTPLCVPQCQVDALGNPTHVDCDGVLANGCETAVTDPTKIYYPDRDNDGYGDPSEPTFDCGGGLDPSVTWVQDTQDCNDADGAVNIDATEVCDGVDNNCSGTPDDSVAEVGQACADSGLPGVCKPGTLSCQGVSGLRCDANIAPGARAETCNGIDDDCDGQIDEQEQGGTPGSLPAWFDADNDGYGALGTQNIVYFCPGTPLPTRYVTNESDCDDIEPLVNPGATENCETSWDDNCNGLTEEQGAINQKAFYFDGDSDSYHDGAIPAVMACMSPGPNRIEIAPGRSADCNDAVSAINPGALEQCNRVDDNCDGDPNDDSHPDLRLMYRDQDGDTHGAGAPVMLCPTEVSSDYASTNSDCNDLDGQISPLALEVCDGVDNNCSATIDATCPVNGAQVTRPTTSVDANLAGESWNTASLALCPDGEFLKADWRWFPDALRPAVGATQGGGGSDFWLQRLYLTCGPLHTSATLPPGQSTYDYVTTGPASNHSLAAGPAPNVISGIHGDGSTSCSSSQAVSSIKLWIVDAFGDRFTNGVRVMCGMVEPYSDTINILTMSRQKVHHDVNSTAAIGAPGAASNLGTVTSCPAGTLAVGIRTYTNYRTLGFSNFEKIVGVQLVCAAPHVPLNP